MQNAAITDLLEHAVATVRTLPPDAQDDVARIILQLAGAEQSEIPLTVEEEASLAESIAQADRGEFATDEEVRAIWAKHGL